MKNTAINFTEKRANEIQKRLDNAWSVDFTTAELSEMNFAASQIKAACKMMKNDIKNYYMSIEFTEEESENYIERVVIGKFCYDIQEYKLMNEWNDLSSRSNGISECPKILKRR